MCDHCAKVTTQKGYSGQVTCRCEHPEKKVQEKPKEKVGCCSRKARESAAGCCQSACCKDGKSVSDNSQSKKESEGGCCRDRKRNQEI